MAKQRIGIDCRLAGVKHAGIGRYTQNLVRRVIANQNYDWVLFFHDKEQAKKVLQNQFKKAKVVYLPIKHYSFKEQLTLPREQNITSPPAMMMRLEC